MTEPDTGATVNEWVNVVRRARLTRTEKYIALLLATYADPDGSSIYPGVARLALQSDYSYRTVQDVLAKLRAIGLIEKLSRRGVPRHFADGYRLIFGPEVLDKASVPTPATEDAQVERIRALYRGRHRAKSARTLDRAQTDLAEHSLDTDGATSARSADSVQSSVCTQWDDTTARNGMPAELPDASDGKPDSDISNKGGSPEEDHRRDALDQVAEWIRQHPESVTSVGEATP